MADKITVNPMPEPTFTVEGDLDDDDKALIEDLRTGIKADLKTKTQNAEQTLKNHFKDKKEKKDREKPTTQADQS